MGGVMTKEEYERTLTNAGASGSWNFYDVSFPHMKGKCGTDRRRVAATLRGKPFAEVDVRKKQQEMLLVNGQQVPISSGYFSGYLHSFLATSGMTVDLPRLRADIDGTTLRLHALSLRRRAGKLRGARIVVTQRRARERKSVVGLIVVCEGHVTNFSLRKELAPKRVMLVLYMFAKLYNGDVSERGDNGDASVFGGAVVNAVSRRSMDLPAKMELPSVGRRSLDRPSLRRFPASSRCSMDFPEKDIAPSFSRRSGDLPTRFDFPEMTRRSLEVSRRSLEYPAKYDFPSVSRRSLDMPAQVAFPC